MTVLVNGRDEPHVVFDVGPLFDSLPPSSSKPVLPSALALTDPTPFTLSLPNTGDVPYWAAGVRVLSVLLSASSAEFTTDLVPVLSMTKLADASTSTEGGGSCFADMLMPGESYYRNSWRADKFEQPNDVRWEDKKGSVPREEAYGLKYLLGVDGNSLSGRYLGLLTSRGLVFKSTTFAEFFTPWLVPYEPFIPDSIFTPTDPSHTRNRPPIRRTSPHRHAERLLLVCGADGVGGALGRGRFEPGQVSRQNVIIVRLGDSSPPCISGFCPSQGQLSSKGHLHSYGFVWRRLKEVPGFKLFVKRDPMRFKGQENIASRGRGRLKSPIHGHVSRDVSALHTYCTISTKYSPIVTCDHDSG
ncbi:hypothetical protein B0H14DRAFT_3148512 [Mycena olivaceomarginata]|nr:hypothetical protein B0H14DRAFT_3148512 [Mycena olivaceomarginata]